MFMQQTFSLIYINIQLYYINYLNEVSSYKVLCSGHEADSFIKNKSVRTKKHIYAAWEVERFEGNWLILFRWVVSCDTTSGDSLRQLLVHTRLLKCVSRQHGQAGLKHSRLYSTRHQTRLWPSFPFRSLSISIINIQDIFPCPRN